MSTKPAYRPDIDGLRAIAVLLVLIYHFTPFWLPGGFVGVDVFFVISGYLITGIIKDKLEGDGFSYRWFFARRAMRLLPALLVTLACSFLLAFLLYAPGDLQIFARALQSAVLGYSNILFWRTSGYFDAASETNALLHTWTLSLEWQFYLVWPAVLWLLSKARRPWAMPLGVMALSVTSLVANWLFQDGNFSLLVGTPAAAWFSDGPTTIFYNMPFRVFEFGIGALILWLPAIKFAWAREAALAVGLVLIGYSALTFNDQLLFPSSWALIPAIGGALAIYAGKADMLGRALNNRAAVSLGLISYSVYLVHWPIFVFAKYFLMRDLTYFESVTGILVSVAVGAVLYLFVEKPFHRGTRMSKPQPLIRKASAVLPMIALFVAAQASAVDGLSWRVPADAAVIVAEGTAADDAMGRINCHSPCEFGNPNGLKILIVGDSHVDHYTKTLERMGGDKYHFFLAYGASCFVGRTLISGQERGFGEQCAATKRTIQDWMSRIEFDGIIIGQRWPGYRSILSENGQIIDVRDLGVLFPKMLEDLAALYEGFQGPIVVVDHAPTTNTGCYARPKFVPMPCKTLLLFEHGYFSRAFEIFSYKTPLDARLVSPVDIICPDGKCQIVDAAGNLLYTDSHHLSRYGAALVVPAILAALAKEP